MFRKGRAEGWLQLPPEHFSIWIKYNEIAFDGVAPDKVEGRGSGLVAQKILNTASADAPVLTVPSDLILSKKRVYQIAKADQALREVLEALGDFGRALSGSLHGNSNFVMTSRGAILTFLLMQASLAQPNTMSHRGVSGPFVDYVRSLPSELLPTYWTSTERALLAGTTLASALAAKFASLEHEFDFLCTSTADTKWFKTTEDLLELEDWYAVDAMYRSRALDFPGIGHCMVPCVDIANHASGDAIGAVYEKDYDGNAVLLLHGGETIQPGEEVTITYGDEKGACEMLFSYGFIEDGRDTAGNMFLGLETGDNDALAKAKKTAADCPPGFKIIDAGDGKVDWTGDYIYILVADDDQGRLRFKVARTLDGEEEMQPCWDDEDLLGGAAQLKKLMEGDGMWEVYQLRAVTVLQSRIYTQLQRLFETQDVVEGLEDDKDIRSNTWTLAMKLRRLEFELLERAYAWFDDEKERLAETETVQKYLESVNGPRGNFDDRIEEPDVHEVEPDGLNGLGSDKSSSLERRSETVHPNSVLAEAATMPAADQVQSRYGNLLDPDDDFS